MIRVLLVDDHRVVLEGLRGQLAVCERIEVVGEATNGEDAIAQAKKLRPDIVLLDISMPGMSGLEAAAILGREVPEARIVALTMHDDAEYALGMIRTGAQGYVLKESSMAELVEAIETVHAGKSFFSPQVSEYLVGDFVRQQQGAADPLTPREMEVLALIAQGENSKSIGKRLYISVRTVEGHRDRIMQKLGIHSIAGLVKFAIRTGLAKLEDE